MPRPCVVGMGTLTHLTVRLPGGKEKVYRFKNPLAWWPAKKRLLICRTGIKKTDEKLDARVRRIHSKFHQTDPSRAVAAEVPEPKGKLRTVGKIVSLIYRVPQGIRSPQKNPYQWVHLFGDHGEAGHGDFREGRKYPEKYMPLFQQDQAGNSFITRTTGNRYFVTDWLYW